MGFEPTNDLHRYSISNYVSFLDSHFASIKKAVAVSKSTVFKLNMVIIVSGITSRMNNINFAPLWLLILVLALL